MNQISVQLEAGNPYKSGAAVYLDINGNQRLKLSFNIEDYVRVRGAFNQDAAEFAYFTTVIYGCDRAVNRETLDGDRWTREFAVQIPVADPEKWAATLHFVEPMLEFLTGDIWHLEFIATAIPLFGREFSETRNSLLKRTRVRGDVISLFSGGLDSLIGVIDCLEDNPAVSIVLASTYDAQAENSRSDQERLLLHLKARYDSRIQRYVARTGLCAGGEDTNYRSRSLAFIGNAVLAASFLGDGTPILIPENGAIALNYPLTPARRGSLSTRTVHPYFILMLSSFLNELGFRYSLNNHYALKTKGEMMRECRNPGLLRAAYADSASCGKRGHKEHWENRQARQCGACVPCIFRRAAVHSVGFPAERYGYDLTSGSALQRILSEPNYDLPSVIDFVEQNDSGDTIWRSLRSVGHLDYSLRDEYVSLVQRIRDEVMGWAHSTKLF